MRGIDSALAGLRNPIGTADKNAEIDRYNQINSLLERRKQLINEALSGESKHSRELAQQNQELIQGLELQRNRAQSGAARIGRIGQAGYNRLNRLLGGPQSERTELEIERLTGFRSQYLDDLGQRRIDASPRLQERFSDDAKSSGELEAIGKRLSEALAAQGRIQSEFFASANLMIDAVQSLERQQSDYRQRIERLEMTLTTGGGASTSGKSIGQMMRGF
jgi:hypothetical protein